MESGSETPKNVITPLVGPVTMRRVAKEWGVSAGMLTLEYAKLARDILMASGRRITRRIVQNTSDKPDIDEKQ